MWLTPRMAFAMLARGALEASICLAALTLVVAAGVLQEVLARIGTEATARSGDEHTGTAR